MRPLLLCIVFLPVLPVRAEQPTRRSESKPERQQQNQPHRKSEETRIDPEVARVKGQMQKIEQSSIPNDRKIQMQRAVVDRKVAALEEQMRQIRASGSKDPSPAGRDRRKAALDNIQKILDIVRGMNPQI